MNRVVKKSLKIVAWIAGSIVFLLLLVIIAIQIPAVQNFAKNKAVSYLEGKLKTKISIDKLSIAFPKRIVLTGIYLEDQKHDTLLAGKEVRVDIGMFGLLHNEVNVSYLSLDGIRANIYRLKPDTSFNFQYIVDAFSSDQKEEAKPKDSSSSMKFHLDKIILNNIVATYKDDKTGNDVYFKLGNFTTRIKKFDLDHNAFTIPDIQVKDIVANVYQYKSLVQEDTTYVDTATVGKSTSPVIQIGQLGLHNINFNYKNDISALLANLHLGELVTHPGDMNLQTLHIRLNDIALNNTQAKIALGKSEEATYTKEVVTQKAGEGLQNPWRIELGKVDFNNNTFAYDDNNKPKAAAGMDFSHLLIDSFTLKGDSLAFTPTVYNGNIRKLSFKDKSGFDLRQLKTNFVYTDTGASLNNLVIQTDKSLIQNKLAVSYPSLAALSKQPGDMYIDADLVQTQIGAKDILTFLPAFKRNLRGNENASLRLNTRIKGYVKDLDIPQFEVSGYGNVVIKMSGRIKGLPDAKKAYADLNITQISASKSDILPFIPAKELANFRLPDNFSVKGYFKGSAKDFATNLALNTNRGNVKVTGSIHEHSPYSVKAIVDHLNLGYLLKQEQNVGIISITANVSGTGTDIKKANVKYAARVLAAQVKGYNYHDIDLVGTLRNGVAVINGVSSDPNIAFNLDATADLKPKSPAVQLNLLLDTINLNALHLVTDTLSMHGHIIADVPVMNVDSLNGNITITDFNITNGLKSYTADSIGLIATATPQQKDIDLNVANVIKAKMTGQYKLTEIAPALQSVINQYYNLPGYKAVPFAPQNWQLNATIIPKGLLLDFVPALKGSDSLMLATTFNSAQNDLDLTLKGRQIMMDSLQIDSLNVAAKTNADKLDLGVSFENFNTGSFKLYKTNLDASLAHNQLDFNLGSADQKGKLQYALGGLLNQIKNGLQISMKDSLVLDYNRWDVAQGNFIRYDSVAGILVNNFSISQNGQSITVNSTEQTPNAPIKVDFNNFQIATITKIAHQDSIAVEGSINGNAVVSNIMKSPLFTSDLQVNNVIYKRDTIGNLSLKVNNEEANTYAADISLEGNNTDVKINGKYYTGEGRLDMLLALNRLNLAIAKPFAAGQLIDIGGDLKGNATIQGTVSNPDINGTLNFDNAFVIPAITGERLTLPNEKIDIDNQGIHFSEFTTHDANDARAVIDGDILTTDFKNYGFALNLSTDNFQAVNKKQGTKDLFYGKMNIDADVDVTGTMTSPSINANLRVNKPTDFFITLPSSDPEVQEREGVVVFEDKDHPENNKPTPDITDTITAKTEATGLDVTANIETDSAAKFTVIIDERSGDALQIQGAADLAGGIDKSGKISLTGSYKVSQGSYNLSLSFLKRKFDIRQGSTITWTGDPTSAQVDLTASYIANTAPIDLMQSEIATNSQAEQTTYKEKLPFNVNLHMTGEMLKPTISFDITLPEQTLARWPDVDAKLQQVRSDDAELNKQAFALLLLGRFVQEDPLVSSGGGFNAGTAVRSSAAGLITDQLNNLAGNLVKGVDLNFDLQSDEDYSTGTAQSSTDLKVGVSKRLLNDRIKVNVGSSFAVENPQGSNKASSNIAGDVSIDYQVTKDGRYLLRAYRQNNYEGVAEGQIIETGLSFILNYDYNRLTELFHNHKENKEVRKKNKETEKQLDDQKKLKEEKDKQQQAETDSKK